ncbi:MAG: helix-turn-helix domain-containing protein [Bacteroidales bacterium]|jgi:excisionase family DNA binding protein|nr:helix-turn-helix domain-containing protein [Bacteroidales bacterium]
MEKTLTVADVAKQLQMSKSAIYRFTEIGKIPSIKIGNRTRVLEEQFKDYILSCKKKKTGKKEQNNADKKE